MSAVRGGSAPQARATARIGNELVEQIQEVLSPAKLKRKVLSLIKKSKDEGVKLATMAEELGLERWRDLVPVTRELIEEGKVEKDDSQYLAT